jgi:hypothetical protein
MFKYWTPIRVKITVLPYKFIFNQNADVRMFPMYTVNDLDLEQSATQVLKRMTAKGHKPFKCHAAWDKFTVEYSNLDRLALQKQQKELFLTNGSWANRE